MSQTSGMDFLHQNKGKSVYKGMTLNALFSVCLYVSVSTKKMLNLIMHNDILMKFGKGVTHH